MWNMLKLVWFNQETVTVNNLVDKKEPFPIIVYYNSFGIKLAREYREILNRNKFFEKFKLINAYKIHSNLRKMLVKSELFGDNSAGSILYGKNTHSLSVYNKFSLCNNTRCITCRYHAYNSNTFTSTTYNASFHINGTLTCKSTNIIYLITCIKCNIQYVGETSRCLADRLTDHRSNINNRKQTPIAIHFNIPGHSITKDLRAITIEKIHDTVNSLIIRKQQELIWQNKLGTIYPHGLNCYPTQT